MGNHADAIAARGGKAAHFYCWGRTTIYLDCTAHSLARIEKVINKGKKSCHSHPISKIRQAQSGSLSSGGLHKLQFLRKLRICNSKQQRHFALHYLARRILMRPLVRPLITAFATLLRSRHIDSWWHGMAHWS